MTRSAQKTMDRLLPTTMLFKHLPVVMADEVGDDIRFLGQVFFEEDGETWAVGRMLRELDNALFFGNAVADPNTFMGLCNRPEITTYAEAEEFYAAVDAHPAKLRLFTPTRPHFVSEGDLPARGLTTFAVGWDACTWKQLLPCTVISLAPMREGFHMHPESIDRTGDWKGVDPSLFKHAGSTTRKRSAVVLYGTLVVDKPDNVLVLNESGVPR
jgi:hypothetical protein